MARIINRPVQVRAGPEGAPRAFRFRRRWHRVSGVLDCWREAGDWWASGLPLARTVWRVQTDDGGLFELDYRHAEAGWYLYKIYD